MEARVSGAQVEYIHRDDRALTLLRTRSYSSYLRPTCAFLAVRRDAMGSIMIPAPKFGALFRMWASSHDTYDPYCGSTPADRVANIGLLLETNT